MYEKCTDFVFKSFEREKFSEQKLLHETQKRFLSLFFFRKKAFWKTGFSMAKIEQFNIKRSEQLFEHQAHHLLRPNKNLFNHRSCTEYNSILETRNMYSQLGTHTQLVSIVFVTINAMLLVH